jgi:serine/threonine protein kinase
MIVIAFGTVYAARERNPVDASHVRHFAVKAQATIKQTDWATELMDVNINGVVCTVHREALALHLLRHNDRVVDVHEAYQHGPFCYIVQEFYGVDTSGFDNWEEVKNPGVHFVPKVQGVPGTRLAISRPKKTHLNAIQANKVISGLVEAACRLRDLEMMHMDLSHRNYLVDMKLNVSSCATTSWLAFPARQLLARPVTFANKRPFS